MIISNLILFAAPHRFSSPQLIDEERTWSITTKLRLRLGLFGPETPTLRELPYQQRENNPNTDDPPPPRKCFPAAL